MANQYATQIIEDGWRNAIAKVTGILDTSDASIEPAIALGDFTNNDVLLGTLVGFRIDHIWHSIGDGIEVSVHWAASPNDILIMALAGRGKETFDVVGGLQPPIKQVGYGGDIHIYTTGFNKSNTGTAPQNFTILLEMVKIYKR
jgi:hypothetical protein